MLSFYKTIFNSKITRLTEASPFNMGVARWILYPLGIFSYFLLFTDQWSWFNFWLAQISGFIIGVFGNTIALHRLAAHRSFKPYRIVEPILYWLSIYCLIGSTIVWSMIHRQHHRYTDQREDPHSPNQQSLWKTLLVVTDDQEYPAVLAKELKVNPLHIFIHKYYFAIVLLTLFVLYLINPFYPLWIVIIPAFTINILSGLQNTLAHRWGYRNYDTPDNSRNNWLLAILTYGAESWHNNHHADPTRYYHGHRWWEFDVAGFFCWILKTNDKKDH